VCECERASECVGERECVCVSVRVCEDCVRLRVCECLCVKE